MRTKALLLTALVSVAGMVTSFAQSNVYSINVVGYVNVTLSNSFTLISNPLMASNNPNTTLAQLIPAAPPGTIVYKFNGTTYEISGWDDLAEPPAWDNPGIVIPAGQGFFVALQPGQTLQITFVGEVAQNAASNKQLPAGFSMTGSLVPQAGGIIDVLLLPGAAGSSVYKFVCGATGYQVAGWDDLADPQQWDTNLQMGVAEGWFMNLSQAMAWNRNFVVP